jgi:tetratricopeptide (TPR) repeat protein
MKWLPLIILLVSVNDIGRIAKTNRLIREAEKAYLNNDYAEAIEKYRVLVDSFHVNDEKAILNLANAYFRNEDKENAAGYYDRLLMSKDKSIRTAANQQMGLLAYEKQELPQALSYFKASLRADPANEDSRYNYELVRKISQEQQQNQDQQSKPQEPPTEFAKDARARAEMLVNQGRYSEAFNLMQKALAIDPTVNNYQDFIKRTGDVAQIDENY